MIASCGGGGGGGAASDVLAPVQMQVPALASPGAQTAAAGAAVNLTIPNTGGNVAGCAAPDTGVALARLPDGLAVGTAVVNGKQTCVITGVVSSAAEVGTYTFNLTATNQSGSVMLGINFVVTPSADTPELASPGEQAAAAGGARVRIAIPNTGGGVRECTAPDSGATMSRLPMGLMVGTADVDGKQSCVITGAVDGAADVGRYVVTITATSAARPVTVDVTIVISEAAPPRLASIVAPKPLTVGKEAGIAFANSGGAAVACALSAPAGAPPPTGLMAVVGAEPNAAAASCVITGRPIAALGTELELTVTATNGGGTDTATVTVSISAPPAAPLLADIADPVDLFVGRMASGAAFANTGGDVGAGGCSLAGPSGARPPAGLSAARVPATSAAPATCALSGAPTMAAQGPVTLTLTATNGGGTDTATVTVSISAPRAAPLLADIADPVDLFVGRMASGAAFANTGGDVGAGGCSLAGPSGARPPAGLSAARVPATSAAPATCALSGTPTMAAQGPVTLTLTATNGGGTDTATVTVSISAPPAAPLLADIADPVDLFVGRMASGAAFANTGGDVGAGGCSLAGPSGARPPAGLSAARVPATSAAPATCALSGTPTTAAQGPVTLTLTATNGGGTDTATVTVSISAPPAAPLLADIADPVDLFVGRMASGAAFANTGGDVGVGGCSLAGPSGARPPAGLSAARVPATSAAPATCALSGTPTTAAQGPVTLTLTATNGGGTDTATVTVSISAPPAAPALADITGQLLPRVGQMVGLAVFTNTGGDVDVGGCSLAGPSGARPPAGLSVVRVPAINTAPATCALSGAPTMAGHGSVILTVTATNGGGTDTATVTVDVLLPPPDLVDIEAVQRLTIGVSEEIIFVNNGGPVSAEGCTLVSFGAALPLGLTIEVRTPVTGSSTCSIVGVPSQSVDPAVDIIVRASDYFEATSDARVSISVMAAAPVLADIPEVVESANTNVPSPWNEAASDARVSISVMAAALALADIPEVVESANTNVPSSWNEAASNTLGAWSFGSATQTPALDYADYDGATVGAAPSYTSGHRFHCDSDTAELPAGAALVACSRPPLIGLQRRPLPTAQLLATGYTKAASAGQPGTIALEWPAADNSDGYRVFRGLSEDLGSAMEVTDSQTSPISAVEFEDGTVEDGITYHYWVQSCAEGVCSVYSQPYAALAHLADTDGNGLIDIATAQQLHNMRFGLAGAGYRTEEGGAASAFGCPDEGCFGYELTANIDFDSDGDEASWSGGLGGYALDGGDRNAGYFDTEAGGWEPVGDSRDAFEGVFEGNGRTISNLATIAASGPAGMFGSLSRKAVVRNLGLVRNLAVSVSNGPAGGVAAINQGLIVASYATGPAYVSGRRSDVGGLVGSNSGGTVQSCFATGDIGLGSGGRSNAGGLVGRSSGGSLIRASYATGNVSGGGASAEAIGGLVGWMANGSIEVSYAGGNVNGSHGSSDYVGQLAGLMTGGAVTASWGFGGVANNDQSNAFNGSDDRPADARDAADLTHLGPAGTNVPGDWTSQAMAALGAWRFYNGTRQPPVLLYNDYDGVGNAYQCAGAGFTPAGATLVPNCGSIIPGQALAPIVGVGSVFDSATAATLSWRPVERADYYRVLRAGPGQEPGQATELTTGETQTGSSFSVTVGARQDYWVLGCDSRGDEGGGDDDCSPAGPAYSLEPRRADIDGNGLIEIRNLAELAIMAFEPGGTAYKGSSTGESLTSGCPAGGCRGYELTADLSFDIDGDGATWARSDAGVLSIDPGDNQPAYFDVTAGGWVPVGDVEANAFTATFDGGGHTITGLAAMGSHAAVGMFGFIGAGADIRDVGLNGNLAAYTGGALGVGTGGLVGRMDAGSITASYTTGDAHGNAGIFQNSVGGLVGLQASGSITASYATGNAFGGRGNDPVGGLVGRQNGGSITASYASGDSHGGAGAGNSIAGLVGLQGGGSITASYATGNAVSGSGSDNVGGLVGQRSGGSITASYATGDAVGGNGTDIVGGLVGDQTGGSITASWGFGTATGGTAGSAGSTDRPAGVTQASQLASANAPASWNQASSNTLGAWNFGTAPQTPALSYADYDGAAVGTAPNYTSGNIFHCAGDAAPTPAGAIVIPNCTAAPILIPGQRGR